MPDPQAVNSMFGRIAQRYDLANHLLSLGIDHSWRRRLLRLVHDSKGTVILDLATGSGDVAFALAEMLPRGSAITGMDFCEPMLDEARRKQRRHPRRNPITFQWGDAMSIPLPAASVDAVTISFGLRNVADRHRALLDIRRVLKPGGHFFLLEFSQPYFWFRPVYYAYLKWMLPFVAGAVTGDRSAYQYLGGSIESFPTCPAISAELNRAGFSEIHSRRLTFGIVALHAATA